MRGFGLQPAGVSPAGFGAPSQTGLGSDVVLPDESVGGSHGSRKINPITRTYVLNEDGRISGMNNVQQLVQLAITKAETRLADIDRLDAGFKNQMLAVLTAAVASLVSQGIIEVVGVSVRANSADGLKQGQAATVFKWRDRTTKEEFGTPV
jgi:hypothetical protein